MLRHPVRLQPASHLQLACLTAVVLSISHRARPVVQVRLHGRSGLQSRVYNLQVGEDMFPGLVRDNGSVQVPLLAHAVRL